MGVWVLLAPNATRAARARRRASECSSGRCNVVQHAEAHIDEGRLKTSARVLSRVRDAASARRVREPRLEDVALALVNREFVVERVGN